MNPISKSVQEVKYRIPKEVLERTFVDGSRYWRPTLSASLEHQIEQLVIRPRVLVDCNLIGGIEALVPLEGLTFEAPFQYTTVIHIPKERTMGKSINSVRNVTFFNAAAIGGLYGGAAYSNASPGYSPADTSATVAVTAALLASFDKIPQTSTSKVSLIAENTILINESMLIPPNSYLRCILEHDDQLSRLPLRSYRYFATLVEYAVKAYIYNTLIIAMDKGELHMGQELGVFRQIVESYADANQNYLDFLREKMESTLLMSDEASYSRFIKLMVGGQR